MASCPGLSPGREHCVVLLGKTLYSVSLYSGESGELNAGGNPALD